jgi:adenine-specific DNA-methyltransferase
MKGRRSSKRSSDRTDQASKPAARSRREDGSPPASYSHPEADSPMRPEIGTQASFRRKKPPRTYRYDSSLSPELNWDGQNPAREQGEALLKRIIDATSIEEAKAAARELARMSKPFLNWAGKAERLSFDVPTLPLFVHERLSTKAILETLTSHRRNQQTELDLFADPKHSITDQVLRAYEHRDRWVNRMILGDSLVVMNSLLEYEGLGGQVQMIYMDPPYGVKFGSNFQPFVRKRDVKHNDDADMTREPEMVQAYRDTWELGLHSYLTYLRDRLMVARELLTPSGSVFVQISDENLHHVRELMDEVFGAENFCSVITVKKTAAANSPLARLNVVGAVSDYVVWYARDYGNLRYRQLFTPKSPGSEGTHAYANVESAAGNRRGLTKDEQRNPAQVEGRLFRYDNLTSPGWSDSLSLPFEFSGRTFTLARNLHWKTTREGLSRLVAANRVAAIGDSLAYVRYIDDFPVFPLQNLWLDTGTGGFGDEKLYVVQTVSKVVERCLLMSTEPGDLVLDPTCGSGTTAFAAEEWGRRWITIDTSRVPLALARQRLLTATYQWYQLKDESRGPAGGFVYARKQNSKGEEIGGIVPHVTLKSIANDEPPAEEVLVDRPEEKKGITRVSGPFVVEATIPTPVDWEGDGVEDSGVAAIGESHASFIDRMLEVLRRSPMLRLGGNQTVTLRNVRPPARSLSLSAEALVDASAAGQRPSLGDVIDEAEEKRGDRLALSGKPVAIVFGPESGAVSDKLVYEAAREANAKNYTHLYVIGFAVQPHARELIENCEKAAGIAATYVQMTPDVMMGDLLKNMRSSQIFSVCGLPDIDVRRAPKKDKADPDRWQVELRGLDVFDPITMENSHRDGNDVPAWLLDTDYNDLCFHVDQAFFPRTSAWENLRRSLRGTYEESVWDHLAGSVSAPFEAGEHRKVAVKVIDDRGNELMVVKDLG